MSSILFRSVARLLVALMLLLSLFLLGRGHNAPGGGFIGGLVAAAAFLLHLLAAGPVEARRALRIPPAAVAATGLLVALLAGLLAAAAGGPFFAGLWWIGDAGAGGKGLALGTPLLFDLGVYLVVLGTVVAAVLALEEEG
jgi:multicomponent Na+:H+ antiporter subunit B